MLPTPLIPTLIGFCAFLRESVIAGWGSLSVKLFELLFMMPSCFSVPLFREEKKNQKHTQTHRYTFYYVASHISCLRSILASRNYHLSSLVTPTYKHSKFSLRLWLPHSLPMNTLGRHYCVDSIHKYFVSIFVFYLEYEQIHFTSTFGKGLACQWTAHTEAPQHTLSGTVRHRNPVGFSTY